MIVDITPQTDALRHFYGTINVAVISAEVTAQFAEALKRPPFDSTTLSDGRSKIVVRGTIGGLQSFLAQAGIPVEAWIVLYQQVQQPDEVIFDEATYAATVDNHDIRVRVGMLDQKSSFVAVQSSNVEAVFNAIGMYRLGSDNGFKTHFTRVFELEYAGGK